MATAHGEETDYESDPEDALLPSLRRREASDDEGDGEASEPPARRDLRADDADSDGQGGAPAYDDEDEFADEEELEEEEEGIEEEEDVKKASERGGRDRFSGEAESLHATPPPESGREGRSFGGEMEGYRGKNQAGEEVEKKETEPYAVPTAGAFYMHDDRFQENGRGRHRRMPGGRKLWETKDDHAWVHDRFEEMNLQDARHDEARRMSKGRFRGRGNGKTRGTGRGYGRGNRSRDYYDRSNDQIHVPKSVRGRGPRRYVPAQKNNSEVPATHQKQTARSQELTSNSTVGRQTQTSNVQPDTVLPRKHVFASSLNSASPPFYPSGSSNQEISAIQKRDTQGGSTNTTFSSLMKDNFPVTQSGSFLKGKAIVDNVSHDRLYMNASLPVISGKPLINHQLQPSGSLSPPSTTQSSYTGVPGRGLSISVLPNYQQTPSHNQIVRVSSEIHPPVVQQRPVQAPLQPALQSSSQHLGQRPGSGNQASSLPQAPASDSFEVVETDSPSGSSNSKTSIVEKGKTSNPGSGKGTFLYNGAQVIAAAGAMGLPQGDQGFPATPALLPVMQFGGRRHGGLGVPAVGMALPGYVAQSQLGFGNSEMTWVPMLAGAAGALGSSYPYIALDSSYYAHPSGQTSSSASSRETSLSRPVTTWKPPQSPEIVNDEFSQRQSKPRRYSEMNFGQ